MRPTSFASQIPFRFILLRTTPLTRLSATLSPRLKRGERAGVRGAVIGCVLFAIGEPRALQPQAGRSPPRRGGKQDERDRIQRRNEDGQIVVADRHAAVFGDPSERRTQEVPAEQVFGNSLLTKCHAE